MKTLCLQQLLSLLTCLPVLAGSGLALELIGPDQPVEIAKSQLEEIAHSDEADEALQTERHERKLKAVDRERLLKMVRAAENAEQGIVLTYRISNPTDRDVTLEHGGDATTNLLKLTGPGARNLPFTGMMTMEFRMGQALTIRAGEHKKFTIPELAYGKRDLSRWVITKPGDYEVTLIHRTRSGGELIELESNPVRFTVVAK